MVTRFARRRGVALIEALIALAIMAFGMLAIVGMQGTLRQNSDLSRQRAEAVRVAQQEIERVRAYALLADPDPSKNTFSAIAARSDVSVAATVGGNAQYTLNTRVFEGAGVPRLEDNLPNLKSMRVDVGWTDRNGEAQNVRLSTAVHGVAPELAGTLSVPPNGFPTSTLGGRNGSIPWNAVPLGDGQSGFIPPQPAGGTVAWRFDNASGVLEVCVIVDTSQPLTQANLRDCSGRAQLLAGVVNFASNAATQATANDAVRPRGTPFLVQVQVQRTSPSAFLVDAATGCFTGTAAVRSSYVEYYCAVPVSQVAGEAPIWSGYAFVTSTQLPVVPVAGGFATCRFTHPDARVIPLRPVVTNVQHPRAYTDVKGPLLGQNFLIVRVVNNDASDCPDGPPLPATSTTFPQPQTPP